LITKGLRIFGLVLYENEFNDNRIELRGGLAFLWDESITISIFSYSQSHINVVVDEVGAFWSFTKILWQL
jgi:hypothetical protein